MPVELEEDVDDDEEDDDDDELDKHDDDVDAEHSESDEHELTGGKGEPLVSSIGN